MHETQWYLEHRYVNLNVSFDKPKGRIKYSVNFSKGFPFCSEKYEEKTVDALPKLLIFKFNYTWLCSLNALYKLSISTLKYTRMLSDISSRSKLSLTSRGH